MISLNTHFRNRHFGITLGILVLALLSAAIGFSFIVSLYFDESISSKRGSLAYYFTIRSKVIMQFPTPAAIEEALFQSSAGDGPKMMSSGFSYTSSMQASELLAVFRPYLLMNGYVAGGSIYYPDSYVYTKPGYELVIDLQTETMQRTKVHVTEYDDGTTGKQGLSYRKNITEKK